VFGGIAGIMAGEAGGDIDDDGRKYFQQNSLNPSSKNTLAMASFHAKSKEFGESQDMYRRNLAAYWVAQPGELPADECIENIFAGGNGWASSDEAPEITPRKQHTGRTTKEPPKKEPVRVSSTTSRTFRPGTTRSRGTSAMYGRASLQQHANELKEDAALHAERPAHEVDEFEVRDDLRSWHIDPGRYMQVVDK